jgi:ATP-dependent Clp protease ATP-binding subunit ClpB
MDISNFSDSARNILTGSSTLAIQNQNAEITSYHLINLMLEKKDNIIYQLLIKMDVEVERFKQLNLEELNKLPQIGNPNAMRFSKDVEQVLENSEITAQSMGSAFIAPEHLFLSILDYAPENLKKLFKLYQITKKKFLASLKEVNDSSKVVFDEENEEEESNFDILTKFGKNLTELAKENKLEPVIGRDDEIRNVIRILTRKTKNNPVLIGEPGVGKTAIVEGLAHRIIRGDVPTSLKGKTIFSLDLGLLIAGAKYIGEFEERLKSIMEEIDKSKRRYITIYR